MFDDPALALLRSSGARHSRFRATPPIAEIDRAGSPGNLDLIEADRAGRPAFQPICILQISKYSTMHGSLRVIFPA
jgi:hypothetical protein